MEEQLPEDSELTPHYEVLTLEDQGLVEPPRDPSKTGNKPKQLKAVEVFGYEVGRGKRKRIVNPEDVYKLAALGLNTKEISDWFDIPYNTCKDNFRNIIQKGNDDLRQSLRMAQLKLALNGNATMLIWLGKNMLGQSDNPTNTEANSPLPWNDNESSDGTE